jgi:iron complex transport system substrate-binding protein
LQKDENSFLPILLTTLRSFPIKMKKQFIVLILLVGLCQPVLAAEPATRPKRIISLAPSMTEILFALGLGDNIVGVTSFCDYPPEAKSKPKIGGMSNPSLEAVVSLKPDLVIMTTDGNPKEFNDRLHALKIKTYVFTARRIAELPRGYREIGAALGVSRKAGELAREIELVLDTNAKGKLRNSVKKTVLFIVWPDPLIVAGPGTVMDDALALLGQRNVAAKARIAYPKYSLEEVIRQVPDSIVIGKGSGMDMRAISQGFLDRMKTVPAVKNGDVCYVSDNLYRLGPRIVNGIKELAECFR